MPSLSAARVLLATTSAKKAQELKEIFAGSQMELVMPAHVGVQLDVEESGSTFLENAVLKATAFAQQAGLPALADDSGLEIDALGGQPGVRSHRFAGPEATDADRVALVLEKLRGVPEGYRTARFRCAMALALPSRLVGTVDGVCEGTIALQPAGTNGFGYDPLFWLPALGRTMAELAPEEKNAISHRAHAGAAARRLVESWLRSQLSGGATGPYA